MNRWASEKGEEKRNRKEEKGEGIRPLSRERQRRKRAGPCMIVSKKNWRT